MVCRLHTDECALRHVVGGSSRSSWRHRSFLIATWVLAVHSDFHEYPSVPSSTLSFPVTN
jgi:hypothetical protein